ncbi:MAG: hypothetical protein ACKV19_14695 [Verrucomicrobiales bacterium]
MILTFPVPSIPPSALLAARSASSAPDSGPGWEMVAAAAMLGLAAGVALGFVASRFLASRPGRDTPGTPRHPPRSWQKHSADPDAAPSGSESPRRPRAWESASLTDLPAQPTDPDTDPPAANPDADAPTPSRRREEP